MYYSKKRNDNSFLYYPINMLLFIILPNKPNRKKYQILTFILLNLRNFYKTIMHKHISIPIYFLLI